MSEKQSHFLKSAFENSPVAQLSVNLKGRLVSANKQANLLFGLTPDDWNRPFRQLEPGRLVGSCMLMANLYQNLRPATSKNVQWITSESTKYLDIAIAPIFNGEQTLLGITLTFLDATHAKYLAETLEWTNSELNSLSENLQAAESEVDTLQMQLEAAHQEIQILSRDAHSTMGC